MKKLLFFGAAIFLSASAGLSQVNIAAARGAGLNSTVIVKGVVINGPEMGVIRYLQDNTGGIAAYNSGLSSLNRGDSVQISGPLTEFKGLFEISTTTANPAPVTFTALGTGITQTPSVITVPQFGENVEGRLLQFIGCTFGVTGTFSTGINYTVTTGAGQFVARVTSSVSSLMGAPIPTGTVDIIGIGSQFCSTPASGCTTGYQLALRDLNDISATSIGINEFNKDALTLVVYPNPVRNELNFRTGKNETIKSIIINDITGRTVLTSENNSASVDVSLLSNGVYMLFVSTDKHNYQAKFTVEK